jgi:hypothetical protein
MAITLADVDGIAAREFFEQANSKAITVENQMAFIQYYNSPPIITLYTMN